MARLLRSYHILEVFDKEVDGVLQANLLLSVQNYSQFITNEVFFEIVLTYNITRYGGQMKCLGPGTERCTAVWSTCSICASNSWARSRG
jgi:hypothetical protein